MLNTKHIVTQTEETVKGRDNGKTVLTALVNQRPLAPIIALRTQCFQL